MIDENGVIFLVKKLCVVYRPKTSEKLKQKKIKFEKWHAICARVGGVGGVLASIAC